MVLSFVGLFLNAFNVIGGVNTADVEIRSNFTMDTDCYYASSQTAYNFDGSINFACDVTKQENETEEYYIVNVKKIYFNFKNGNNVILSTVVDVNNDYTYDQFANGTTNVGFRFGNSSRYLAYDCFINVDDETFYHYGSVTGLPVNYPSSSSTVIYKTYAFDFSALKSNLDNVWVANTNVSYQSGYHDGFNTGYYQGEGIGYSNGYADGFEEGMNIDETAFTVFNGILNIALVPVNFFLGIFNFEILGINIAEFVTALLTVACTIIVVKIFAGSKGGGE